ncbi:MAG: c-type cytochrome [Bacteroidales bacterium]|nr:c-type cytochrome [Bacteroidales bacterium]
MINTGIVFKKPLALNAFLKNGLLILLLLFSSLSFGQTAEAEANFAVCKACHTIGGGKLVGPDLKGVTERREEAWILRFVKNSTEFIQSGDPVAKQVFEENNSIPMPPNNLTDEQIKDILLYIENGGKVAGASEAVVEQTPKPAQDELESTMILAEKKQAEAQNLYITFIILSVLIVISIFDLLVSKILKARWIHVVIMLISVVVIGEIVFLESAALGRQQYYQPEQPIMFSHKVHAGQNKIDCKYCHFTADESMHAGIPPVNVCMNCHSQVKQGKLTGTKEIDKIYSAIERNKPIEWIKVHNLPDHVYFNHAQHVNVGKVACAECHGPVEKMDQIIQVEDLSMGWCIQCHREKEVQFADNKFYDQYTKLHQQIKSGKISKVTVQMIGGDECQKCHY